MPDPTASKRWTLIAATVGSSIVFLDSTIVPVALPRIGEELPATFLGTLEGQSYVYYGYLLSLSALLILAGALADFYGRRRLFVVGLVGFGATSALCGLAPNMETLVVARLLQGAAGAVLVPGSLALITATFEGPEQGRAFGIWAGASAATTIAGPIAGGALVAYVSWRAAFLVNLPLVVGALWATVVHVAESRDQEATGRFDWWGAFLVAVAVGGLTLGPIRGQAEQWQDPIAYASLVVGAAAAIAFPFAMRRSSHPLVPLELFRSRNFNVTNVSTLVIYGALYVMGQFTALFIIGILGYNEIGYAIATVPASVFLALLSTRFGALADRFGPRLFMTVGPAVMGASLLWLARTPADSEPWRFALGNPSSYAPPGDFWVDLMPPFAVFGVGLAIMVAPLTTALMRSVPVRHSGVASAFNNAVSRVGPQLAGALLFIAITVSFYAALGDRLPGQDPAALRQEVSPLNPVPAGTPRAVAGAAIEASTEAFHLAMFASALLCFTGAAINAWGIRNPAPEPEAPSSKAVVPCPQAPPVETPHSPVG
ncbi:MAG TPA: MFS transporter [Actinomycetota bacterium]|nr:MFS transporter [Actinomycetota bacterium]